MSQWGNVPLGECPSGGIIIILYHVIVSCKRPIDPNFPQKRFFLFFGFIQREISLSGEKKLV